MKINVLKAGSTLSESGDARFTLAALDLAEDPSAEVRQTVRYVYEDGQRGILNLETPGAPDPNLVAKVVEILKHGNPDSQAVVLPLLAALPKDSRMGTADGCSGRTAVHAGAVSAAGELCAGSGCRCLPSRVSCANPALREQVLDGLRSVLPDVQRAAVRISLEHFLTIRKPLRREGRVCKTAPLRR